MTYKSTTFRADGGPALADFQSFVDSLNLAVNNTVDDPDKFERFARKVLVKGLPADRTALKLAVNKWIAWNENTRPGRNQPR